MKASSTAGSATGEGPTSTQTGTGERAHGTTLISMNVTATTHNISGNNLNNKHTTPTTIQQLTVII